MDRNTIIGFVLIFAIILGWQYFMKPSPEELAEQARLDSLRRVENLAVDSSEQLSDQSNLQPKETNTDTASSTTATTQLPDSVRQTALAAQFGGFAPAASGTEKPTQIENDLVKVTLSNKGGRITSVELKDYSKISEGEKSKEIKEPLRLMEDEKNQFDYYLPVNGAGNGTVKSSDLYFSLAEASADKVVFRAPASNGGYFEQSYALTPGHYGIDYQLRFVNLGDVLDRNANSLRLNWVNYLDKLEKNVQYERNYSTIYYKPASEGPDHCSCTGDDLEEVEGEPLKWVSNTNQFFNSTLITETPFKAGKFETILLDEESNDLKKLVNDIYFPFGESDTYSMEFYTGPNEFDRLAAYDMDLQDVIPFGRSIFGTINRWVIRPIFAFLSKYIGSAGIVILVLTLIVKLLLYPLSYRMLYSQSKMGALKPHLAKMKEKHDGDQQKQQQETMKLYQEFGVNPLGGCLPVIAQMPIWFALYRFFPAAIEFRQTSFLWATDLSSYDVAFSLPWDIPFYGDHVSLFTLLWAGTTVAYTYYNTKHMDMGVNPAMKYMQYFMPIMFLFFFNNFAAGLTCYLLFSNIMNIAQTIITKNYIIDQDKIMKELEAYRKKPKKKGGFQERLQKAMKEQQKIQAEREAQKKGGKKKR